MTIFIGCKNSLFNEIGAVPLESVVEVTGTVQQRPAGQENKASVNQL